MSVMLRPGYTEGETGKKPGEKQWEDGGRYWGGSSRTGKSVVGWRQCQGKMTDPVDWFNFSRLRRGQKPEVHLLPSCSESSVSTDTVGSSKSWNCLNPQHSHSSPGTWQECPEGSPTLQPEES